MTLTAHLLILFLVGLEISHNAHRNEVPLQNRAGRIITGSSFTTSALPLIESLGWKTIEELTSNETNICVFKALNGLAPQYLTELFSRN